MKRFLAKNRAIVMGVVCATVIIVIYAIMKTNVPECVVKLGVWPDVAFQLSIGFIINFVFFLTQIYIPQYRLNQQANRCIKNRIAGIISHMRDIFDQLGYKYVENYNEENVTKEMMEYILHSLKPDDKVAVVDVHRTSASILGGEANFTSKDWIISRIRFVESDIDKLLKYYAQFITPELTDILERILKSTMHQSFVRIFLQIKEVSFESCEEIFLYQYFSLMKELETVEKQYQE